MHVNYLWEIGEAEGFIAKSGWGLEKDIPGREESRKEHLKSKEDHSHWDKLK